MNEKKYSEKEIQEIYDRCVKEPNSLIETVEDAMKLWCRLFDRMNEE